MRILSLLIWYPLVVAAITPTAFADEPATLLAAPWSQFLGPQRNGISNEQDLNFDWLETPPKILWRETLGSGYSSLSVIHGHLFTMAQQADQILVACFHPQTGKPLWRQPLGRSYLDNQRQGPGPRATPTFHRGQLFCMGPSGELACLNAGDGKIVWQTNVYESLGITNPMSEDLYWGLSSSPLVEGDLVICFPGGKKEQLYRRF